MSGPNAIPGAAERPSMRWAARCVLWSILEVSIDKRHQRFQRCLCIASLRAKIDRRILRCLGCHHLDHTLCNNPRTVRRQAQIDPRLERLRKLGQLDRGTGMQPDLVSHEDRCTELVHAVFLHQTGVSSSAVRRTASRVAPEAASVAAMTAPPPPGALQTTPRSPRGPGKN